MFIVSFCVAEIEEEMFFRLYCPVDPPWAFCFLLFPSPHVIQSNRLKQSWHFFSFFFFYPLNFLAFLSASCTCSTRCSWLRRPSRQSRRGPLNTSCVLLRFNFTTIAHHLAPANRGLGLSDPLSLCNWQTLPADSILAWYLKTTR